MRSWSLLALAVLAAAGCGTSLRAGGPGRASAPTAGLEASDASAAELESGAALYMRYCASCHGESGRGDGPAAEALRRPPTDLTRLAARWGVPLDRAGLSEVIDGRRAVGGHGKREMPVWGERLYRGERPDQPASGSEGDRAREAARSGTILLILEYLETRQRPADAPADPSAARGRARRATL